MNLLAANNNEFTQRLPINIFAQTLDFSFNAFTGPVVLFNSSAVSTGSPFFLTAVQSVGSINLAGQIRLGGGLRCPIQLASFTGLVSLELQSANFSCDFYDATQVQLPSSISLIDISDNAWAPMVLRIPPTLNTLRANRAGVVSIEVVSPRGSILQELSLDGNHLLPSAESQLQQWTDLFTSGSLESVSCRSCSLQFSFTTMLQNIETPSRRLQVLRLSQVSTTRSHSQQRHH